MNKDYQEVMKELLFRKHEKQEIKECLHMKCPECDGSGRKADGSACIHMISCPCPKCTLQL